MRKLTPLLAATSLAAFLSLTAALSAHAAPVTYTVAPGATTLLDVEYGLNGGLVADVVPFPTSYTNFDFTLTAKGAPGLYAGTYTESSSECFAQAGFDCAYGFLNGNSAGDELIFEVADPSGFNGASPLPLVVTEIVDPTSNKYPGSVFQDNDPNASLLVTPSSPAPEPSSLMLLASGLGSLGVRRWLTRNA